METHQKPTLNVDILIIREGKVLLGLFSDKWKIENGKKFWGVPGQEISFLESFGDAAKRYARKEIGCEIERYVVFAVNANYALNNHFVGIGVWAEIEGEPANKNPEDWDKWKWFDLDDLPADLFPPARNVINSFKQKKVCVEE
jgi:8-oxo-dGTP diphosphatase